MDVKFENRAKKLANTMIQVEELEERIAKKTAPLARELEEAKKHVDRLKEKVQKTEPLLRKQLAELRDQERSIRDQLKLLATERKLINYASFQGGYTISTVKGSALAFSDPDLVPAEYLLPPEKRFKVADIKKAMMDNAVPGVEMIDSFTVRVTR